MTNPLGPSAPAAQPAGDSSAPPAQQPGASGYERADADYNAARNAVAAQRAQHAADNAYRNEMEVGLRTQFGEDYNQAMNVLGRAYDRMTPAEQELLESEADDVKALAGLLEREIGPLPTDGQGIASDIAKLEQEMRKDLRAWHRNDRGQLRLRALYRLRDGGR